jgi:hypothetical protein
MPNAIKYNVSAETLALKKGNFYIGTGDVGKGPTSSTGYYNGITPPSGGYTIYLNKASGGPSIYTVSTEAQMVSLTNSIGSQSFTTSGQCLNWFATQTDKMIFNMDYPAIITDGLVLNVDAGFTPSYPTTGTTWYDISGNAYNGALYNGPTFNSANSGSIVFDGVDDYCISTFALPQVLTVITVGASIPPTWSNFAGLGSNRAPNGYIIHNNQSGTDTTYYILNSAGNYFSLSTVTPSNVQNPNFYAMSTNGSNLHKSYLNGNLMGTDTTTIDRTSNPSLRDDYLGWDSSNFRPNNCKIYIHLVYNRQLTDNEITQNFNALKGRFGL